VIAQSPEPGTQVRQGSAVTISVSTGETPRATVPNLLGLTFDEAVKVVQDLERTTGVKISLFQQPVTVEDASQVGRIVDMAPTPGTSVTGTTAITVYVGRRP
jgi:beta-lactam-binding protein with PASTA domain